MATKYDQYETDGYLELNEAAPVIYISQAGPASLAAQICHRLGLPVSCIAVVPTTTVERDSDAQLHVESLSLHKHEMNCAALDRMIREDTAAGKKPCIVLANGGSPALGHDDPIHLLRVVCNKHKVWLHVRGPNLSTKCLSVSSIPLLAASQADSITLSPADWYGVPTLPTVTLLKQTANVFSGAMSHHHTGTANTGPLELAFIPLWLVILSLGHGQITQKTKLAQDLTAKFAGGLSKNDNIDLSVRTVGKQGSKKKSQQFTSFSSFIKATKDDISKITTVQPVMVCFRLAPTEKVKESLAEVKLTEKVENEAENGENDEKPEKSKKVESETPESEKPEKTETKTSEKPENLDETPESPASETSSTSESPEDEEEEEEDSSLDEFLTDLYDSLNVRLFEKIQENLPRLTIDAVSLQERIFLRFQPIQSAARKGTTDENLDHALSFIQDEVDLSTKLISQIQAIRQAVSKSDNLDYYCDPDSFSLGLLQVVPTFLQHLDVGQLSEVEADDLDLVNKATLQRLSEVAKLKFAMITADVAGNKRLALHLAKIDCENDETEIGHLIGEISRMGHDAERDLLELKEFTKNLIEAKTKAEAELFKTKEKCQGEESVIEKIPIMGSLVGLFFGSSDPAEVNKRMVGRSFNVKTGNMQSTKKVYDAMDQNKSGPSRPETPKIVSEEMTPPASPEPENDKNTENSPETVEESFEEAEEAVEENSDDEDKTDANEENR